MTTTVTIKHDGPNHHDVAVTVVNANTKTISEVVRLAISESVTRSLWDSQSLTVTEIAKQ